MAPGDRTSWGLLFAVVPRSGLFNYPEAGATAGGVTCPTGATTGCIVPLASTAQQFDTTTSTSSTLYGPRQLQLTGKLFF